MQRQQELYEKSKSTYDKASRSGLKVREPPPPPAPRSGSPAVGKVGSSQVKKSPPEPGVFVLTVEKQPEPACSWLHRLFKCSRLLILL